MKQGLENTGSKIPNHPKKVVSEIPKIQDQKNIKASTYTLPTIRTVLISNNVL